MRWLFKIDHIMCARVSQFGMRSTGIPASARPHLTKEAWFSYLVAAGQLWTKGLPLLHQDMSAK
jgi:hypothetical protein